MKTERLSPYLSRSPRPSGSSVIAASFACSCDCTGVSKLRVCSRAQLKGAFVNI